MRNVPLVPVNLKTLSREGMKGLQVGIEDGLNLQPSECHQPVMSLSSDPGASSSDVPRCNCDVKYSYETRETLYVELYTEECFWLSG